MNGIQFLLLAFCLTLIKVINALLIGRADRSSSNSGWLFVGIGFFRNNLGSCNCCLLSYLLDHLSIANISFTFDSATIDFASKRKTGFCAVDSFVAV